MIKKDNTKLFQQHFSIIKQENFSSKYRDPFNHSLENKAFRNELLKEKEKPSIIKEDIIAGVSLMKELDKEIEKRKNILFPTKSLTGKKLMEKIKKIIFSTSTYAKKLSIPFSELVTSYKISPYSFSCSRTKDLIYSIRVKDLKIFNEIIDNYKDAVLDFDYFHLTPLHWAAKKNFYVIIPKLIEYGAEIDCQNFLGETPLHIGVQNCSHESIVLLLIYLASPFIKDKKGKKPIDYTNDFQLSFILNKAADLNMKHIFDRRDSFYEKFQKDFIQIILDEYKAQLSEDAISIILQRQEFLRNATK